MKKLLFSLALVGAVIPSFAVNSVNWENFTKSGRWGKRIPANCFRSSVVCRF